MPTSPNLPPDLLDPSGPSLCADRRSYIFSGHVVEGFTDRTDISDRARALIARWAQAFTPETLSLAQRLVLGEVLPPVSPAKAQLLDAAIMNAEMEMPLTVDAGLYQRLSPEQIQLMREPWLVLGENPRREYPLSSGELAQLTSVSVKQVRSWEQSQLLPVHWIDGRRYFFSAAVVFAFVLTQLERNEIRALTRILSAAVDDPLPVLVSAISMWRQTVANTDRKT